MREDGTELVDDIFPKSPIDRLDRNLPAEDLSKTCDVGLAAAVLGMNRAFITRALGRPGTKPKTLTIQEVLDLLDVDNFQETFIPRSKIPRYLIDAGETQTTLDVDAGDDIAIVRGNARDLVRQLAPGSVQCVVTSSPYWGMRVYENTRPVMWADEEHCAYGFEQTPEGFIRHTIEILHFLKPAIDRKRLGLVEHDGHLQHPLPDPGNARERLDEMGGAPTPAAAGPSTQPAGTAPATCSSTTPNRARSAARIAERASRVGYRLKSYITWRKSSATPEPVRSRGTRQAEYILHLAVGDTPPLFNKAAWQDLELELGGPHPTLESAPNASPTSGHSPRQQENGHGAEFPLRSPAAASRWPALQGTWCSTRSSAREPPPSRQCDWDAAASASTSATATSRSPNGASLSSANGSSKRLSKPLHRRLRCSSRTTPPTARSLHQPSRRRIARSAKANATALAVVRAGVRRQERELAHASPVP